MNFDKKKDFSKVATVELSDDALEGVSGGVCVTIDGVEIQLGDVSSSPSTPKPPAHEVTPTLNGVKDSNLYGEGHVGPFNTCSNFRASRSTEGGLHTCGNCVFFAEVSGQTGGYCCYPNMARS